LGFSLKIKKVASPGALGFKFTLTVVLLYFFILYPGVQFFFRGHPFLPQYCFLIFYGIVFAFARCIKKVPLTQLGFSKQHVENHLITGLTFSALIIAALPALDSLISVSGLENHELFSGNLNRREGGTGEISHPLGVLEQVLLVPLLEQFFFTGLIVSSLSKKFNPVLAIYGAAVIFTLAHFKLNLGLFILGLITAVLFQLTGTLYASILFHASCSLAGLLLLHVYPRLTTLLAFLF